MCRGNKGWTTKKETRRKTKKNHGIVNEVVVESNDSFCQKHDVAPEFRIYADLSHGTQAMNTDIHRDKGR